MLLAAKDIFCIQRYEIFHEIPNSGGDFSTNGPEKGFRGRVAAHRGRFPGPQPGEGQRVQRRGTGTGRGFCGGAGAGPARSAVGPGAGRGRNRRGFCGAGGGGTSAFSGAGQGRDGGGTGSSEVQTGRAGRREGGGHGQSTAAPPPPKGRCGVQSRRPRRRVAKKVFRREDAPAARTQKKCSEGKVRRRPNTYGHKKNGPRSVHFYFCYTTLLLYGLLLRDARPIHPAARQRLRTPGARLFCGRLPAACSPATACLPSISVCPSVGGHSRESLRHPEPQPLSRPPVGAQPPGRRNLSRPGSPRESRSRSGRPRESLRPPPGSQFSAAGVIVLSRPGSRPSAARNLPSLLLAPSAAGVTAPPRRYGRPPAAGESPASSSRRASPAWDSTAYRPAP